VTSPLRRVSAAVAFAITIVAALGPGRPIAASQTSTPLEHILVLMQENHTFDNYFGTYPGAEGIPEGVCMPLDPFSATGDCVEPFQLGANEVLLEDPVHNRTTQAIQYNGGAMDGFVYALEQRGQDGRLAMAHYGEELLPYYWNLVGEYVLFDHFFSSAAASFANHMFWVAGVPADERPAPGALNGVETIFDRLQEAGIDWKFYVQDYQPEANYRTVADIPTGLEQVASVPLLNIDRFIDDPELNRHIVDLEEYYVDLERGTLPAVAYMVSSGPSEHPVGQVISGQRFVRSLIQALMRSDAWESSAFMVTYDDWGGWYDHVPPPQVDEYGYGFRVPAFLVGGYARRGHIESATLDYTSILRFVEDNWGLAPLASRDETANSIAGAFDFERPPREPTFIGFDRTAADARPAPRREVLYVAYSVALALALLFVWFASRTGRSARIEAPHGYAPERSP
jgi:phospholipase C